MQTTNFLIISDVNNVNYQLLIPFLYMYK